MDMREIIAQALNKAAKAAFPEADFEPAALARALAIGWQCLPARG